MEADGSPENEFRAILERFRRLDASHASLKEQLNVLIEDESGDERSPHSGEFGLDFGRGRVPGYFSEKGPARNPLEHMGHAVHVWTASSGKIVYWNHSAEKLYGWKAFEAIGQRVADLLINEEHFTSIKKTLELLSSGCTWSGQFSFKKRSGETFMALVTESPLSENGELVGVITVSSDAAVFNGISSEELREYHDLHDGGPSILRSNLKELRWHPKPQSVSVPQIAPTVSQLASKVKLWRHEDDRCNACTTPKQKEEMGPEDGDDMKEKPEIAGKFLAQIQIGGIGDHAKENNQSAKRNDSEDCLNSDSNKVKNKLMFTRGSEAAPSCRCKVRNRGTTRKRIPPKADTSGRLTKLGHRYQNSLEECHECLSLQKFSPLDAKGLMGDFQNFEVLGIENDAQQPVVKQRPSSGESMDDSHLSSSGKGGNNELNLKVNCEVRWEELHLKKQIGKGSCAVVYRGIWNGSDVAVKVYSADEYHKGTSPEYVKEISIMRRLRHPNVLLFMGAVCSHERLASVTEFLPRGSLFRTLHKNSQGLDIRRRLRMALDVAKGLNYLHCRNPPIVHRDLKSSNLLVDKNWTVKVGDFGLSKLKKRTLLTTNSGRGTPQWMAPEVLRNEPSNEKSDVFSFGVILWELMTLSIPWVSLNPLQVVGVVGFMDRRLDVPEGLNPEVSKLIHDCWRSDPGQRPPFKDIIQRMTAITQQSSKS